MSKILIYENPQDFLQIIEDLQDQYNKNLESQTSKRRLRQWINQQGYTKQNH